MRKTLIYLIIFWGAFSFGVGAADYGQHKQFAEIDFEDGAATDRFNNLSSTLLNEAQIVTDTERSGKVLQFSAENKGSLRLDVNPLSDTLSISFWGKREDADPSGLWRMFLALYAEDGSNIYLTPLTSWGANSFLIMDQKPYASYKSLAGDPVVNNEWYHFAIVFADNYIRYYLNGELQIELISLFRISDFHFTKYYFGCNPELNYPMSGKIDDLKIFHSGLYDNQIKALYKGEEIPQPEIAGGTPLPTINITADMNQKYQTVSNFGASDGWNAQTVGLYFSEDKKEEIAELLFSTDNYSDGTPKGIGLSAWRFNIGAGTAEQGDNSRISHYSRRTECFLNPDKQTYNWNKQAGQRWFLEKAAKVYGVEDIIGWQNSPPVYFTKRGLGFCEYGDSKTSILKREHYGDFGNFVATVFDHFKKEGIEFKYLSPLNEPQWEWNATSAGGSVSQEGSPWMNQEVSDVVKSIDKAFVQKGITTKQFITESASINYLLNDGSGYYAKQLYNFWDPASALNVSGLPSFSNHVSTHSYWTDDNAENIVTRRNLLRDQIKALNKELDYWQTEYCLLGNGYKFGHKDGQNRALSPMECGISLARIIHNDLSEGDAAAWQWWTTFEFDSSAGAEERFALIRFELNQAMNDGLYRTSKLLYTLGNYSRFIRKGMQRIGVDRSDRMKAVDAVTNQMFSAYTDGEQIVIVAVNAATQPVSIKLDANLLSGGSYVESFIPYVTSENPMDNLKRYPDVAFGSEYILPATSVVTFVGEIEDGTALEKVKAADYSIYPNPFSDYITVAHEEIFNKITLRDLLGNVVKQEIVNDREYTLAVGNLDNNIYLITVESPGEKYTQKISKRY